MDQPKAFQVGDMVDVRQHGRAVVIAPLMEDPASPYCGRYKVQYDEDGTTFWVTARRLRPMKPAAKRVTVAFRTEEYRQAVVHNAQAADVCLEVGCHAGVTTRMIHNRTSFVVGVDTSAHVVGVARDKHPHIRFEQLDGLDTAAALAMSPKGSFSKVFIDISGQAPLHLIVPMIQAYLEACPAARIIVKNRALHRYMDAYERLHGVYVPDQETHPYGQPPQQAEAQAEGQGQGQQRETAAAMIGSGAGAGMSGDASGADAASSAGAGGDAAGADGAGAGCCCSSPLEDPEAVQLMERLQGLCEVFRHRSKLYDKKTPKAKAQRRQQSRICEAEATLEQGQAAV